MKYFKSIVIIALLAISLLSTGLSAFVNNDSGGQLPSPTFLATHPIEYSIGDSSSPEICTGIFIFIAPAGWPLNYKYPRFTCPPTKDTVTSIYPIPVVLDFFIFFVFYYLLFFGIKLSISYIRKK